MRKPDKKFRGRLDYLNQWPFNLRFYKPRVIGDRVLGPVRGGRWSVRKDPEPDRHHIDRPWRAWSGGRSKKWNRWFATQQEAIAWATYVAQCYAAKPPVEVKWPKSVPALTSMAVADSIGP